MKSERRALVTALSSRFIDLLSSGGWDEDRIRTQNADGGFSIDLRLGDEGPGSHTRCSHVQLDAEELEQALADARMILENPEARTAFWEGATIPQARRAEPWFKQITSLHGGDNRRSDVDGMPVAELAVEIPASPASIKRWLAGECTPNLAAQAAIERLYNEHRKS